MKPKTKKTRIEQLEAEVLIEAKRQDEQLEAYILVEAKRLDKVSKNWMDFSNSLFSQEYGLLARLLNSKDRKAFCKSKTYKKLHRLVERRMKREGI
jgi:uncharacterized protein YjcR